MSKPPAESLQVTCPCCSTRLTLDPETGAILLEERVRKGGIKSFEEAVRDNQAKQEAAKAQLDQAMEERRHKDEIFEKKFREALKKAEEDDEPPPRPFDFD